MPELSNGTGLAPLLTYAFAVFGVIALLGLVLWFVRRSGGGTAARKPAPVRRLAVVDQITLDDKRRLVLVQRDGVQHLVILGGANELLVESGIIEGRGARRDWEVSALEAERELPAFPAAPAREAPVRETPVREPAARAPRPAPEPRLPEPQRRPDEPELVPSFEPVFAPAPRTAANRAVEPGRSPAEPPRLDPGSEVRLPRRPEPVPTAAPIPVAADPLAPIASAAPAPAVFAPAAASLATPVPSIEPPPAFEPAESGCLEPAPALTPFAAPRDAHPALPQPPLTSAAPEAEPPATPTRSGGLLSRLGRKRPAEAAPAVVAPVVATAAITMADQARIAFSEPLPEMPDHAAPEPMIAPESTIGLSNREEPVDFAAAAHEAVTADAAPEPMATRAEPDMSRLFEMIAPVEEPAAPEPVAPAVADTPDGPRTAVKIDPFFASMAQRLEETLRRPLAPPLPPQSPASTGPAPEPRPGSDELELEMASLLGRAPQR